MSFYGTVFYEFERLFYKFKFKNVADTVDTVDLREIDSTDGIIATERWDTFHIDSGNRWIKLASMNEDGERKGVTLFHANAGPATESFSTMDLKELEEGEEPDVELDIYQAFNVPTISYDNAGHVTGIENTTYRLPEPQKIITDGMTSQFESDITPQGFEHDCEFPADDAEFEVLEPGQPVAVTRFLINDKGVVTGVEPVYYKMPASDAEQDFAELDGRMTEAEEQLTTLFNDYAPYAITGKPTDLYDEDSPVTKAETITEAIGNIEDSNYEIFRDRNNVASVAAQIKQVFQVASAVSVSSSTAIGELATRVDELTKRVEALENPNE